MTVSSEPLHTQHKEQIVTKRDAVGLYMKLDSEAFPGTQIYPPEGAGGWFVYTTLPRRRCARDK